MTGLEQAELLRKMEAADGDWAVFFHTPLCGTCKIAERMLVVVEHMLPGLQLFRCNVNLAPDIVNRLKIASIPCVVTFQQGKPVARTYKIGSVEDLLFLLLPFNRKAEND